MLVPIYTFNDHPHRLKYMSKFDKDVDIEELLYDKPHPEGHFGHFGNPWHRIYKNRTSETQYYYPVIVDKYALHLVMHKIIIPEEVIKGIKEKNVKILFLSPLEGWEWRYWETMIANLSQKYNFITEQDCVVMSGNLSKHPRIKSVYFNFWEKNFLHKNIFNYSLKGNNRIKTSCLRKKKFIFLNRRPSSERIGAVALMYPYKNKGYMSLSQTGYYDGYYHESVKNLKEKYNKLHEIYQSMNLDSKLPLKIHDGIDVESQTPCNDNSEDKFYHSYLHIVSETFIDTKNDRIFYSEKTFKPILFMQPFILLGEYKSLENLRTLGYKTFHEFIDESYDTEKDDQERILKALDSASRFLAKTRKGMHRALINMLPILTHNISHLQYRCMIYDETIRTELLTHLKDKL